MHIKCKACRHPDLLKLNDMLMLGSVMQSDIARKFGLSEMCISRHKTGCIQKAVMRARFRNQDKVEDRLLDFTSKALDAAEEGMTQARQGKKFQELSGLINAGLNAVDRQARLTLRPGFVPEPERPTTARVSVQLLVLPSLSQAVQNTAQLVEVQDAEFTEGGRLLEAPNSGDSGGSDCEDSAGD